MTLLYIIAAIGIFLLITRLVNNKKDHTYNAKWGNSMEYLSMLNHGFAVTGSKALTKNLSHENCALFGPTGSGKSSVVIISSAASLARGKSSIIFNDVTGEVYDRTSAYLAGQGYKILRLDFSNSKNSETFNPLLECKSIADIQKVALLIIRNSLGTNKGDVFWEQSATMLISLFARYLVFHTEPEFRTLQNVLRLIEKFAVDPTAIDRLFIKTDEDLLNAYKATIVVGDKTLQSIIATTRTALNLFCDPEVCRTTATNSIDFNLLRNQPVALYVCNPLKDLTYFRPLSALFFQSLFNYVLSRIPGKEERSIFFVIDEAASMRFPDLAVTVSNIRKFRAGVLLCMQDEMALTAQYGQAEAHQIKTNCGTQVYLKGQPLHTATELSRILGKHTHIIDDKGTERTRELMTPDEVRVCQDAIILISNKAPLKCRTVPYFKNMWLNRLTKLSPYPFEEKEVSDPPLIPIM